MLKNLLVLVHIFLHSFLGTHIHHCIRFYLVHVHLWSFMVHCQSQSWHILDDPMVYLAKYSWHQMSWNMHLLLILNCSIIFSLTSHLLSAFHSHHHSFLCHLPLWYRSWILLCHNQTMHKLCLAIILWDMLLLNELNCILSFNSTSYSLS